MIKVFNTLSEYNTYISGGLVSGDLYYVVEDGSTHFRTNNVNGIDSVHNMIDEDSLEEGSFVANGEYEPEEGNGFSSVTVNVPASAVVSGTKSISENGSNIDVTEYATVDVDVPIPSGYIQPSGNLEITENGEGIDVAQYSTVDVNVAGSGGSDVELVWEDSVVASDNNDLHMFKGLEAGKTYAIKVASVNENNGLCLYGLYNGSWIQISNNEMSLSSNNIVYQSITSNYNSHGSVIPLSGYSDLAFVLMDYTQGPVAFQVAEVPQL